MMQLTIPLIEPLAGARRKRSKMRFILIAIIGLLFFGSCANGRSVLKEEAAPVIADPDMGEPDDSRYTLAYFAMEYLRTKNYDGLSGLASSQGIRFSPHLFVNMEEDQVLTAEMLQNVQPEELKSWGEYDGSGDTILLGISDFTDRIISPRLFNESHRLSLNTTKSYGNSVDNLKSIYPQASFVEYYLPGTPEYSDMDWRSVRIVMVPENSAWRIIGVIAGRWTI